MSEACDWDQANAKKPEELEQVPIVSGAQLAWRRRCWLCVNRSADAELPFEGRPVWQAPWPKEELRGFKAVVTHGA